MVVYLLSDIHSSNSTTYSKYTSVIIVGILGFALSFVLSYLQAQQNKTIKQRFFTSAIVEYEQHRDQLFEKIFHEMSSLSAFMSLYGQTFDRQSQIDAFDKYFESRGIQNDVLGLYTIGLIDRVPLAERVAYEHEMQNRYGSNFTIFTAMKNLSANGDAWVISTAYPVPHKQYLGLDFASGQVSYESIRRLLNAKGNQSLEGFDISNVGKFTDIEPDNLVDAVLLFKTVQDQPPIDQMLYILIPLKYYYQAVFSILPINHPSENLIINFYQNDNERCVLSLQGRQRLTECAEKFSLKKDQPFYDVRLMPSKLYFTEYIPTPAFWTSLKLIEPLYIFLLGMLITLLVFGFGLSLIWQRNQLDKMVLARTSELETNKNLLQRANEKQDRFLLLFEKSLKDPLKELRDIMAGLQKHQTHKERSLSVRHGEIVSHQISATVDDILALDRLAKGTYIPTSNRFSLSELVATLQKMLHDLIEKSDLYFAIDVDETREWWMLSDDVYLLKVLINLLENAIEHTTKGFVSLSIKIEPMADGYVKVNFAVSDTGVGMPPEKLASIRRCVYALRDGEDYPIDEMGASLSPVSEFVNLLGSSLDISSSQGIGSTFSFSLMMLTEMPQKNN